MEHIRRVVSLLANSGSVFPPPLKTSVSSEVPAKQPSGGGASDWSGVAFPMAVACPPAKQSKQRAVAWAEVLTMFHPRVWLHEEEERVVPDRLACELSLSLALFWFDKRMRWAQWLSTHKLD
ncbi:PREDICTED: uncharacterized protein LOC109168296 [Ipomoea nil]|uniref:uncharacterized protein LOC109168296 n=1 Tax=Ipomoea nil TaxID=35883 RepID=UPI000901301E|nr:PREDICTED: uncharacterized protein LOC109168296 [Ipomoea nil]